MNTSARGCLGRLLLALALVGLPAAHAACAPELRVSDLDGDGVLLEIALGDDLGWVLQWNHSVTGIEVSDYYRSVEGRMVLTDSHTPAFDAGLGHIPGRGRLSSDGEHGYWIRDIDEPVPGDAYVLRVGAPSVDHRVVHAGTTTSLSALAAGRRVRLELVSCP